MLSIRPAAGSRPASCPQARVPGGRRLGPAAASGWCWGRRRGTRWRCSAGRRRLEARLSQLSWQRVLCQGAYLDGAQHAAWVDEECRRRPDELILMGYVSGGVYHDRERGVEVGGEFAYRRWILLAADPEDNQAPRGVAIVEIGQLGKLLAAGNAPRRPEVQHHGLAMEVAEP